MLSQDPKPPGMTCKGFLHKAENEAAWVSEYRKPLIAETGN